MTSKPISALDCAVGNVRDYIFDLERKLEALEQQLAAERVVKVPPERFRYGESEYDDGFANGWNAYKTEVTRELSAIGIPVEGE
ncbi:hypothetical protein [Pectobacterium brasiliense]|uniref:hypothetical protein n=1 Tax=Pectobacterium brasiliense TaxID=180957 RepID=UPI001968FA21|nr:hypothetical protein [Pectobacterium brasiliense]MBN3171180.1 hypothetical protein [Pectobacterium brasiliense]